jgi:glucose/arabinose dehydrogenase
MFRISAAAVGLAAALALPPPLALAQQASPVQQAPAPAWAQGRPDSMAASPLAPHAPRLTVTAPDRLPVNALRVPEGFKVEVWAHGAPGVRMLAEGPNGTVFGGARAIGRVYAISEEGGQRRVRTLAQGLNNPNGVAVRDGDLYVVAINRVLRYDGIEGKLDNPGQPVELTQQFNLPTEEHHGWKFAAFSPDGRLTMNIGVPCNICEFDRDRFAMIVSFRPDGSDRRVEAKGIRNSGGLRLAPATRELWATNNGRDWAGNEMPHDTLHRIRRPGEDHGFPVLRGRLERPGGVARRQCSEFEQPAASLGPHTAPLGARFYTGTMFPEGTATSSSSPPRVLEPRAALGLRRGGGAGRRRRRRDGRGALPDRLPRRREQPLPRPPVDVLQRRDGSLPGERRAERRDLPHLPPVSLRGAVLAAALAAVASSPRRRRTRRRERPWRRSAAAATATGREASRRRRPCPRSPGSRRSSSPCR